MNIAGGKDGERIVPPGSSLPLPIPLEGRGRVGEGRSARWFSFSSLPPPCRGERRRSRNSRIQDRKKVSRNNVVRAERRDTFLARVLERKERPLAAGCRPHAPCNGFLDTYLSTVNIIFLPLPKFPHCLCRREAFHSRRSFAVPMARDEARNRIYNFFFPPRGKIG